MKCDCGCGKTVKPGKRGKRFYEDACRARYSRDQKCPGKVARVTQLANGTWSIIVRYPSQPKGIQVGSQVRVEKADQ